MYVVMLFLNFEGYQIDDHNRVFKHEKNANKYCDKLNEKFYGSANPESDEYYDVIYFDRGNG